MQVFENEEALRAFYGDFSPLPRLEEYPVLATLENTQTGERLYYVTLESLINSEEFKRGHAVIRERHGDRTVWDADLYTTKLHSGRGMGTARAEVLPATATLYIHAKQALISSSFFLGLMSRYKHIVMLKESCLVTEEELIRAFKRASSMDLAKPYLKIELERTGFKLSTEVTCTSLAG